MTTPVLLHQYLDKDLISINLNISSRKKLLEEMAKLLASSLDDTEGKEGDKKEKDVYHCLLEREKIGNTGIGKGVALPHSRCRDTEQAIVAIITLAEPVDYDSLDRVDVDVAFGLLVPENANQQHLNLLAEIARFISDEDNKLAISRTSNSQQCFDIIKAWATQG